VPGAKLDGAKEGWRKDSVKEHHDKMPISGQLVELCQPDGGNDKWFRASLQGCKQEALLLQKRARTWTEVLVVAIVEALECVLDHIHSDPEIYNGSNIFCPPTRRLLEVPTSTGYLHGH
jgi:hypothetical protein